MKAESDLILYDTTLRDGLQQGSLEISLGGAKQLATELANMGIPYVEAGFPSAGVDQMARVQALVGLDLKHTKIAAFGRTRGPRESVERATDLEAILASGAPVATLVGKSRRRDVIASLQTTPSENLRMIRESIGYLLDRGLEVIFDAEHFFDGLRGSPSYALSVIRAAYKAGARWIVLCDTNGGATPEAIVAAIKRAAKVVPIQRLGFHGHNDRGRGVANAEAAFRAGVCHLQGTINGYGERVGNTDFSVLIPNLFVDYNVLGLRVRSSLARLTRLAHLTAELLNINLPVNHPWVGTHAGYTTAGMHVSGLQRQPDSYLHADLGLVGNDGPLYGVSGHSGRANIIAKAREFDLEVNNEQALTILKLLSERLSEGYDYTSAEASLYILMLEALGLEHGGALFEFEAGRVLSEFGKHAADNEATIRASRDGEIYHTAGSGNGPVDALHEALTKVLAKTHPASPTIRLTGYWMHNLDPQTGTASRVRVLIESTDGERSFVTVGVGVSSIAASWEALLAAAFYSILRNGHPI